MRQLTRSTAALSAVLVLLAATPGSADPDRRFGYPIAKPERERNLACYMKTESGQLINLDVFCVTGGGEEPRLGTGDIQTTLRWTTTDDLDLAVADPSGQVVFYKNPRVPSGGQQDVDANADCVEVSPSPVENIFWPTGGAPKGQYTAEVRLFRRCAAPGPVSFTLTLLVGGKTETLTGTVDDSSPVVRFPFTLTP